MTLNEARKQLVATLSDKQLKLFLEWFYLFRNDLTSGFFQEAERRKRAKTSHQLNKQGI